MSSDTKCLGHRSDGEPCRSPVVGESGYCFAHDPERTEEAQRARRRGGYGSSAIQRTRNLAPASLRDVYTALEAAMGEVHDGRLAPARASAMAALARAMMQVITAGEVEERVRSLEATLIGFVPGNIGATPGQHRM